MLPERAGLVLAGVVIFLVGVWPHRDRSTLAVALVVIGAIIATLGVVLPYIKNVQGEVAGVSLQLALVQLPEPLSTEPLGALRGDQLPDDSTHAFASLLRHPGSTAYSVVSLGDGDQWLTSRLLVFAVVLQELRGTRCLVITKRHGGSGLDRFVGTVTPDDLRRCFAWRYPWLTGALAQAWELIVSIPDGPGQFALTPQTADRLLQETSRLLVKGPAQHSPDPEWTLVRGRHEHARWVDESTLVDALGSHLNVRRITAAAVSAVQPTDVLKVGGQFVALVNHHNRFVALLDREALMEAELERPARY